MARQYVAMKAFIIDEENDTLFLMHKGNKDALNPGKWEVPGGKMEYRETTTETFKREVKEESGLDIEVGSLLTAPWQWTFTNKEGEQSQIIAVGKVCRAVTNDVDYSQQTETDDLVESGYVPIKDVLHYDLIPNLIPTMQGFVNMYFNLKANGIPVFTPESEETIYESNYTGDVSIKHHK